MVTENTTYIKFNERGKEVYEISVNNRAATREAIISDIRAKGVEFISRSDWRAKPYNADSIEIDWEYSKIAIHHAGRSSTCGVGHFQMQEIQNEHMNNRGSGDIRYHYALDCSGMIYEGRDIRFKGAHVSNYNTGVIGIVLLENLTEATETFGSFFAKTINTIPAPQKNAANVLISVLKKHFHISVLGGHREFPKQSEEGKICPGNSGISFVTELRSSFGFKTP
jgi:hypothetical protein